MLFLEITVALVLAVVFGFLAHLLRQPPIIGFILAGIAVGYLGGPGFSGEVIEGLAPIGVALLLFLVGLEMNFKELRNVGIPAALIGFGQIIFTFGAGYLIATWLGFNTLAAVYISIALTFSSTIIVVKLLSEKKDLSTLYGRIVVGSLLIQDLVAILALVFLAGIQDGQGTAVDFALVLVKGGVLVGLTFFVARFFPRLLDRVGRSQEMLYLFSIAWALGLSALTETLGLSIEVGGFLAGIALANSSEHFQIGSRMKPIRDFFLILFFVGLGARMLAGGAGAPLGPAVVLSLFVLLAKPLIVMVIAGLLGYRSKTSFLASVSLAQISEFGLIIVALGVRLGHITGAEAGLVTLVGIATIFISSYFIIYGGGMYKFMRPVLRWFEFRRKLVDEDSIEKELEDHIILVGVHRTGDSILKTLQKSGAEFIAVDFDPVLVTSLKEKQIPIVYGDITDEEIQDLIGLDKAKAVISTIPNEKDNLAVLSTTKERNKKAKVILTAQEEKTATEFYKIGANYVIQPHFVGGWELAQALGDKKDFSGLIKLQKRDAKVLDLRTLGK